MDRDLEDRIAALARDQHGIVTRTQLLRLGFLRGAVQRRVKARRLRVLHRGIYLVGPIMPAKAREMAAVLACGPSAVLSHRSAAALWELVSPAPASSPVEVTVQGRLHRQRAGVHVRRARRLEQDERATLQGIPVTTPIRTLVDLAAILSGQDLERAVARAERTGRIDVPELADHLARYGGRPGIPTLRAVLDTSRGPALTRSEAEIRFLRLVRKARLPAPGANAHIGGYEIDFLWRPEGVAVEVDGYRYHASRASFEGDRRRATHLAALGISIIPVTWRQIVDDGMATMVQLAQALLRAQRRSAALMIDGSRGRSGGRGGG